MINISETSNIIVIHYNYKRYLKEFIVFLQIFINEKLKIFFYPISMQNFMSATEKQDDQMQFSNTKFKIIFKLKETFF